MIRLCVAFTGFVVGLWLFNAASVYQGLLAGRGQGDWSQLINDAPFMLRFVGAVLLTAGGAFSFRGKWLGFLTFLVGTLCYVLLTAAMVLMGTDISLWKDEAILSGGLILLCVGLFLTRSR